MAYINYVEDEEERLLVKQLSKGNIIAFNSLFRYYGPRLYNFAFRYLKSEEEAEELVQEVFTIIWEKREGLKEELSFKSFLFTIAFNIIKKHFRARTYLSEYYKYIVNNDSDGHTAEQITYNSLYQFVNELVNKLPERRKEIFIKSRFEGLSINEIAKKLGISHKTVENQLTDALKFIKANIKNETILSIILLILFHN
jgi:RNA polymerase sigma-70 factor (ECF subfamily)